MTRLRATRCAKEWSWRCWQRFGYCPAGSARSGSYATCSAGPAPRWRSFWSRRSRRSRAPGSVRGRRTPLGASRRVRVLWRTGAEPSASGPVSRCVGRRRLRWSRRAAAPGRRDPDARPRAGWRPRDCTFPAGRRRRRGLRRYATDPRRLQWSPGGRRAEGWRRRLTAPPRCLALDVRGDLIAGFDAFIDARLLPVFGFPAAPSAHAPRPPAPSPTLLLHKSVRPRNAPEAQ